MLLWFLSVFDKPFHNWIRYCIVHWPNRLCTTTSNSKLFDATPLLSSRCWQWNTRRIFRSTLFLLFVSTMAPELEDLLVQCALHWDHQVTSISLGAVPNGFFVLTPILAPLEQALNEMSIKYEVIGRAWTSASTRGCRLLLQSRALGWFSSYLHLQTEYCQWILCSIFWKESHTGEAGYSPSNWGRSLFVMLAQIDKRSLHTLSTHLVLEVYTFHALSTLSLYYFITFLRHHIQYQNIYTVLQIMMILYDTMKKARAW